MRLSVLLTHACVGQAALNIPSFFLDVGEREVQNLSNEQIKLPNSVSFGKDVESLIDYVNAATIDNSEEYEIRYS